MIIEKLFDAIPPETNCVLTPKNGKDVLTITFPQSGKKGAWQTGIGFEIWLMFCNAIHENQKRARKNGQGK